MRKKPLLHLINDDDEIVSACAINFVENRKRWALVPDLEHVLAFRRAEDWFVFEAASWTLAAHRIPDDKRRSLWVEPLPAVELVARLRQTPVFALVSVDELFRIVGAGRQVRHDGGQAIYREGIVPDSLHVLLDGRVLAGQGLDGRRGPAQPGSEPGESAGEAAITREIEPPAALGFEEVVEGRPLRETTQAWSHP